MGERMKDGDADRAATAARQNAGGGGLMDPRYESGPLRNELEGAAPTGPAGRLPADEPTDSGQVTKTTPHPPPPPRRAAESGGGRP